MVGCIRSFSYGEAVPRAETDFFFPVWLSLSLPRRITGRQLFVLCLLGKLLSLNLDVFKIKLTVVLS